MSKSLDIKYDYPPLDTTNPTKDWRRFKRDLLGHAQSIADESGSNGAEHLLGVDMGGPLPAAPALPAGGGAAALKMQRLRRVQSMCGGL